MFKPKVVYKVVEVQSPRQALPIEGQELRDGLRALQSNPFFRFMLDRLRLQQLALEANLKGVRHKQVEDVHFVQSGIFWTGWLSQEVERLTQAPPKPELAPFEQEEAAFNEIDRLLSRVGIESPTSDKQ